jgi:seryl-tRNA synthetase
MLDIRFIRENPETVKENIKKKLQEDKLPLVDDIVSKDEDYRRLLQESEKLRHDRNEVTKKINETKKSGGDVTALMQQAKDIPQKIKDAEEKVDALRKEISEIMLEIPNIMHESVPLGKDDSENVEVEKFGEITEKGFEVKSHVEICENLGVADFDSSARVSGNGFYYIEGDLALMNQALLRYAVDVMTSHGFTYVETPLMLREEIIDQVTDLADKQQQIYVTKDEPLALIGTSEHSLIGRFAGQTIEDAKLPIKHTSYSMCFRKEIGSHGIDEKGLFRTHQFNKIEMVVICKPEESMDYYEKMKKITVEIFDSLDIPGRVLAICSGDLGVLKHVQVDVEAWSPRRKEYFEVGSCSNLTEAQAIKLNIRASTGGEKYVPHTLNNTAIATSRAMVAIIENFQNEDGSITIPGALRPYMNNLEKIEPKK